MRTARSWEEALERKGLAQTAWSAVLEHRRRCAQCRRRVDEMSSSVGIPAWQAGIY